MLTKRENLLETIHGGHPDRFVNQYEFIDILFYPPLMKVVNCPPGGENVQNSWGVYNSWQEGQPGSFPVHTPDKIVIKDITHWRDYVHAPTLDYSDAEWEPFIAQAEAVDRKEKFVSTFMAPGLLEMCHHLGEIKNTMINFYEEPESMHELIEYLKEYELKEAELICDKMHPDAMFHHDDWGGQISTFMSPDMFNEFFLDPYKEIYSYWKSRGVELIVHHSDCFAATLVPSMIEMGVDIWQGVMTSNNIPDLIDKYGGKISFMGGIDDARIDYIGWTPEVVDAEVKKACDAFGYKYFIPCTTHGLAMSVFPGVYDETTKAIDEYSKVYWKEHNL